MSILIDSSIWIDYFRGEGQADVVDLLIEENLIVTNDLILAELIPALYLRKQIRLVGLLQEIKRHTVTIEWDHIEQMQITCMKKGINGIGISDLIIAQNAIQNDLHLFSRDKHFKLMSKHISLSVHGK